MFNRSMTFRRRGAWTRVVIFITLQFMLLESLIEWALILYLYAIRHVDSKMTPSLIIALVASFFTVPLVALHSLLAWQYNRVLGFASQKALLHAACTYIVRLTVIIWVAASVAGLVVVSQQTFCLADDGSSNFWKIGISCALHRASVIDSILSFVTVCLFFCSRELSERPYDISLLGIYRQPSSICDDKISSSSTLVSHISLENDIYTVCRRPDVTYGKDLYLSSSNNSICKSGSLQHPLPLHLRPQLKLDTECEADSAELFSGTTLSASGTPSKKSFRDLSSSDIYSNVSRTPTKSTYKAYRQAAVAELSGSPAAKHGHKRHKSSESSFRRFLPKLFGPPVSLSADPQIRALADPSIPTDLEQQAANIERPPTPKKEYAPGHPLASSPVEKSLVPTTSVVPSHELEASQPEESTLPRPMSINSAEAPEVVVPEPLRVHRSNTSQTARIPRPSYHARPSIPPVPRNPVAQSNHNYGRPPLDHGYPRRQSTRRHSGRQRQVYRFEPCQIPRHTQSQYHPQHNRYSRRAYFDTARRMPSQRRRSDVEIVYSSTRRPRSNTCGGMSTLSGPLDSIRETGASVDEVPCDIFSEGNTYRGTTRTSSVHGY
ncbi:uncharacterized protein BO80DRAFT_405120 [Aspergillus ibericus CBS 121593]|uniref:Uncharacterized protein n=1 Tax=Aspergillus ibericus CBS 121593 TaxID=1448316 RepID=A0A395H2Y5_9EURO|nr:hypothetical protein BO80DRAFT_405120 [Aspergillus ibericus CBS 121593]RAL01990.1 hypothetical protein BO80DRAFT_405120 [Aspergillus ibericus CBS 121593]